MRQQRPREVHENVLRIPEDILYKGEFYLRLRIISFFCCCCCCCNVAALLPYCWRWYRYSYYYSHYYYCYHYCYYSNSLTRSDLGLRFGMYLLQVLCPLCRMDWPGAIQADPWDEGSGGDAQRKLTKSRLVSIAATTEQRMKYLSSF